MRLKGKIYFAPVRKTRDLHYTQRNVRTTYLRMRRRRSCLSGSVGKRQETFARELFLQTEAQDRNLSTKRFKRIPALPTMPRLTCYIYVLQTRHESSHLSVFQSRHIALQQSAKGISLSARTRQNESLNHQQRHQQRQHSPYPQRGPSSTPGYHEPTDRSRRRLGSRHIPSDQQPS